MCSWPLLKAIVKYITSWSKHVTPTTVVSQLLAAHPISQVRHCAAIEMNGDVTCVFPPRSGVGITYKQMMEWQFGLIGCCTAQSGATYRGNRGSTSGSRCPGSLPRPFEPSLLAGHPGRSSVPTRTESGRQKSLTDSKGYRTGFSGGPCMMSPFGPIQTRPPPPPLFEVEPYIVRSENRRTR